MEELENSVRPDLWMKVEWGRVACGHLLFAHPLQNIGNLSGGLCTVNLLQGPDPTTAWHLRPLVLSFSQPIVRKHELTVRPEKKKQQTLSSNTVLPNIFCDSTFNEYNTFVHMVWKSALYWVKLIRMTSFRANNANKVRFIWGTNYLHGQKAMVGLSVVWKVLSAIRTNHHYCFYFQTKFQQADIISEIRSHYQMQYTIPLFAHLWEKKRVFLWTVNGPLKGENLCCRIQTKSTKWYQSPKGRIHGYMICTFRNLFFTVKCENDVCLKMT